MTSPSLVVLTDFYAVTNRALSYAAGLAVPLQAHLVLLHVRHDELLSPEHRAGDAASPQRTRQALSALADEQPVPTQVDIEEGYLPVAVAEAVRHHRPRLVVLGRPDAATTPTEVVVGAALDVLRYAPCPLLLVPYLGWDTFPPRRLALAVDGQPFSLYEDQHLVPELLGALDATFSIVHVVCEPAPAAEAEPKAETTQKVLREVQRSGVATLAADTRPLLIYHASPVDGILQGAAEAKADLLVLVARPHHLLSGLFHHSVTAQLIAQSPIPLLLLPSLE
ncbi:universal stress protein [Hymenobacter jeollabukensis]|uniref:Universal stress protein n=1 Tax=Hymenobacter jeollabukensis TaxID=2025313 RepID=A0A5R8WVD3_9BACT|nr:universal stress protein [Hymenobacter jeollabukensis]TLM96471.1 universal stress protein [Hymenobacter jeollabukensis]